MQRRGLSHTVRGKVSGPAVAATSGVRLVTLPGVPRAAIPTCHQVAEDYRFDYKLYTACKDDVSNLCKDVEQGEELECLVCG